MKIVLGFDDSPHAQAALEWIRKQRWPLGTRVVVASAVRAPVTAYAEVYAPAVPYPVELVEELTRHHQELTMRAESELREAGFSTTARVSQGDPREVLVDLARAHGPRQARAGERGRPRRGARALHRGGRQASVRLSRVWRGVAGAPPGPHAQAGPRTSAGRRASSRDMTGPPAGSLSSRSSARSEGKALASSPCPRRNRACRGRPCISCPTRKVS